MDNKYWDLTAKQLNGRATPAEQEELRHWLDKDPSHVEQYRVQQQLWELTSPAPAAEVETDAAWQKVHSRIKLQEQQQEAKVIPMFRTAMRLAASIVLLIGLAWLGKNYFFPLYGMEVIESGNRQVLVSLPDSSRVWLNKGSRLVYDADFDGGTRAVQLEGEAFFDVYKDTHRSFVIQTNYAETKVLGTSFNLRAYPGEKLEELTVATGKVSFASTAGGAEVVVTPGYAATLNRHSNSIRKYSASGKNAYAWKTGKLQFHASPLKNVLQEVERYYGITLRLQNAGIANCRFTGGFEHSELEEVLQVLEATLQLEYTQQDKDIFIITGQGCR